MEVAEAELLEQVRRPRSRLVVIAVGVLLGLGFGLLWFGVTHVLFPVGPSFDTVFDDEGFAHSSNTWVTEHGDGTVTYEMPVQVSAYLSPNLVSVDEVPGLKLRGARIDSPNAFFREMPSMPLPARMTSSTEQIIFIFDFDDCSTAPETVDLVARFDGPFGLERSIRFNDIDSTVECVFP